MDSALERHNENAVESSIMSKDGKARSQSKLEKADEVLSEFDTLVAKDKD